MKKFGILVLAILFPVVLCGQGSEQPKVDYSKLSHEVTVVPKGVTKLEEKSLPRSLDRESLDTDIASAMKGQRVFSIIINPGEKIRLTLKCIPSKAIKINWVVPVANDLLLTELKRLNLNQLKLKSPRIELKNKLPLPYEASFYLAGSYDTPYTVTIDRN
ncbi:MAG: hypothetical protein FWG02_01810 [Holophagaceae bacterium]|nr:hypothetical protein [Holophagaceae bacterium]